MAKERKQAPVGVVVEPFRDERLRVVMEKNSQDPEHEYFWAPASWTSEDFSKRGAEVVHDENGKVITNGFSILARMPKEVARSPFVSASKRSLESLASLRFDDQTEWGGPLRQFRKFRSPPGEVDAYGRPVK
jgi:hypothetical protein